MKDLEWVKAKLKKDHKDGEVAKSQIKDGEKIDGIDLNSYWRGRQTANYIARCYLEDLDEPETLSEDWIQEHSYNVHLLGTPDVETVAIPRDDLQNLLVPEQEELDRAYHKGFKEGERQTAEYFESITKEPSKEQVWKYLSEHGIEVVDKEPETVADVVTTFWKSYERLKEVMSMEVEELEEC